MSSFITRERVEGAVVFAAQGAAAALVAFSTRYAPVRLANLWTLVPISKPAAVGMVVVNGVNEVALHLLNKIAVVKNHTKDGYANIAFRAVVLAASGAAVFAIFTIAAPNLGLAAFSVKQAVTLVAYTGLADVVVNTAKAYFIDKTP